MAFFNKTNADIGNTLWGRFQVGLLFMIMLLQPFKSLHGFYDGLLIISLVIIWLVEAIRPKPKFAVRERKWPFMMRLMPGSALYLLLWLFNIYPFLQSFSIFSF